MGAVYMVNQSLYLVNGLLCEKEKKICMLDIQVNIYRCNTLYFVFLNKVFAFDFKVQIKMNIDDLIDYSLKEIVNVFESPDDVRQFSRKLFKTSHPNGNMLIEYEKMMECKKRIQEVVSQEWIDCVKTFIALSA
jgi:hypothetical protein